jgi:hypothetical protein
MVDFMGSLWDFRRMVAGVEFSPSEVKEKKFLALAALQSGAEFTILGAAIAAGVSRWVVSNWIREDSTFAEMVDDAQAQAREAFVDMCERKLAENASKGDNTAIIFSLKTQGKARGYQERSEVHHTGLIASLSLEDAAKRIAFALNAAIDKGEVVEGSFTDVLPLNEIERANRAVLVEASGAKSDKALHNAKRKKKKPV